MKKLFTALICAMMVLSGCTTNENKQNDNKIDNSSKNNPDKAKEENAVKTELDPKAQLEFLGYKQNKNGQLVKTIDQELDKIGEVSACLFDFENKEFAFAQPNKEDVNIINWGNSHVTLTNVPEYDMCLYDIKTHKWIKKDCGIENEIIAMDTYTAFLKYLTDNKIMIEIK